MPPRHVRNPSTVTVYVDGERVGLTVTQANTLARFDDNGVLSISANHETMGFLGRRGWVLRSCGRVILTPEGRKIHDALRAYLARKAEALRQEEPK